MSPADTPCSEENRVSDAPFPSWHGERAQQLHAAIITRLHLLLATPYDSPLNPGFVRDYRQVLTTFEEYQQEVMRYHGRMPSCRAGCATCCGHWVEDVNSFEAALIAGEVLRRPPPAIDAIMHQCRSDMAALEQLADIRDARTGTVEEELHFDETDILLGAFYQLRRPCPLLSNGRCSVYDLRPLTCRIYFSFSHPSRCDPDHIHDEGTATFILDVDEEANALFDRLHERFCLFEGESGLRRVLLRYLEHERNGAAVRDGGTHPPGCDC